MYSLYVCVCACVNMCLQINCTSRASVMPTGATRRDMNKKAKRREISGQATREFKRNLAAGGKWRRTHALRRIATIDGELRSCYVYVF